MASTSSDSTTQNNYTFIIMCIAFGLILLIIALYILICSPLCNIDEYGNFGSFLSGTLGVFVSLISILLLWSTLSLQREALEKQKELFDIQQFENTFFNLAKIQQDIRLSIECKHIPRHNEGDESPIADQVLEEEYNKHYENTTYKSNYAFKYIKKELKERVAKFSHEYEILGNEEKPELIVWACEQLNVKYESLRYKKSLSIVIYVSLYETIIHNVFGHYLRHLYHILLYIKENRENEIKANKDKKGVITKDKKDVITKKYLRYAKFLQAQMSDDELFLTFYNALRYVKAEDLVIDFNFLENLHKNALININDAEINPKIKLKSF